MPEFDTAASTTLVFLCRHKANYRLWRGELLLGDFEDATVQITLDTRKAGRALSADDVAIHSILMEAVYLSGRRIMGVEPYEELAPIAAFSVGDEDTFEVPHTFSVARGAIVRSISYSNPFDLVAWIKGVPAGLIYDLVRKIATFQDERQKLEVEIASAAEDVIFKRLNNIEKVLEVRRKLISEGLADPEAFAVPEIGNILLSQGAIIGIAKKRPRRGQRTVRSRTGRKTVSKPAG